MLHADQPPADIQTTDAGQLPFIEYRNVGRSAADIQVGHSRARLLRKPVGARSPRGQHGFQIRSGRGDHKIARKACQRLQNLVRVLLARRLAGNDDRAGPDISRTDTRCGVFLPHDFLDRLRVDLRPRPQRRKVYPAAVDDLFFHDLDARRGITARPVLDRQSAKYQLCGGCPDIHAHAAYLLVHGAPPILQNILSSKKSGYTD